MSVGVGKRLLSQSGLLQEPGRDWVFSNEERKLGAELEM